MVRTWYEVRTRSVSGKDVPATNEEFIEAGNPKRFRTLMEANEALHRFVERTDEEIQAGVRLPEHGYKSGEFKVCPCVEITENGVRA